jgi:hypothetical protein
MMLPQFLFLVPRLSSSIPKLESNKMEKNPRNRQRKPSHAIPDPYLYGPCLNRRKKGPLGSLRSLRSSCRAVVFDLQRRRIAANNSGPFSPPVCGYILPSIFHLNPQWKSFVISAFWWLADADAP